GGERLASWGRQFELLFGGVGQHGAQPLPRRAGGHFGQICAILTVSSCRERVSSRCGTPAFEGGGSMRVAVRFWCRSAGRGDVRLELLFVLAHPAGAVGAAAGL